ncbi:hypothetical protein OAG75_00060 [bacterium]|nr:hypothetical protein [bacterium]
MRSSLVVDELEITCQVAMRIQLNKQVTVPMPEYELSPFIDQVLITITLVVVHLLVYLLGKKNSKDGLQRFKLFVIFHCLTITAIVNVTIRLPKGHWMEAVIMVVAVTVLTFVFRFGFQRKRNNFENSSENNQIEQSPE